jgi:broad specificity phosphatase PhoE
MDTVARELARLSPSDMTLLTSPARRAIDTARSLSAVAPSFVVQSDLAEADFGAVDGLTFDDLPERFPDLSRALLGERVDIDWPGGESAAAIERRAVRALASLDAAAATRDVVAVSHGWFIGALVRAAGMPSPGRFAPGSVVALEGGPAG